MMLPFEHVYKNKLINSKFWCRWCWLFIVCRCLIGLRLKWWWIDWGWIAVRWRWLIEIAILIWWIWWWIRCWWILCGLIRSLTNLIRIVKLWLSWLTNHMYILSTYICGWRCRRWYYQTLIESSLFKAEW